MSLNKFTDTVKGGNIKLKIGCLDLTVNNDLKVIGNAVIGGINYKTPDLGLPTYSLHTDGVGNTFWDPDATGGGDITYNGIPPVVVGQHMKFSATTAATADQSVIIESGGNLDIANLNLTNVATVNTVDPESMNDNRYASSTGVINGGVLSVATTSTFDITDGFGYIYDTPPNTLTKLTWAGLTGITVTNLAASIISYVTLTIGPTVVQRTTRPTPAQLHDEIFLGVLVHVDLATLTGVDNQQAHQPHPYNQLCNFMVSIGFLNISGNVYFGNAANDLKFDKTAGEIVFPGIGYSIDHKEPNNLTLAAISPCLFQYRYQDGSNRLASPTGETVIRPGEYDDGSGAGSPGTVPSAKYTAQRIYSFTANVVKIQPGQFLYDSISEAEAAVNTEAFVVEPSILDNGIFRAFLIVKGTASNLNNSSQAKFISVSKFGDTSSAGSGSITNLQQAYDNSIISNPHILSNITQGPITFQSNQALDTDTLLDLKNIAGASRFGITGEGGLQANWDIKGKNISGINRIEFDGTNTIQATLVGLEAGSSNPTICYENDRTTVGTLGRIDSTWVGTEVTRIKFEGVNDAVNQDEGEIVLLTRGAGDVALIERFRVGQTMTSAVDLDIGANDIKMTTGTLECRNIDTATTSNLSMYRNGLEKFRLGGSVNTTLQHLDLDSNDVQNVNKLQLKGSSSGNVELKASATTAAYDITMPNTVGTGVSNVFTANGSGVGAWKDFQIESALTNVIGDGTNDFTGISGSSRYYKTGRRYDCFFDIAWTGKGSASGDIKLELPATIDTSSNGICFAVGRSQGVSFTDQLTIYQPAGNTNFLYFRNLAAGGGAGAHLTDVAFSTAGLVQCSGTFYTA